MFKIFNKKKIEEQCEKLILGTPGSGMVHKTVIPIPEDDYKVIEIIEEKIRTTIGEVQAEWVGKHDIFTSRNLFEKYNNVEKLKEIEKIRSEVLGNDQ